MTDRVTIFADASVDHRAMAGGWGAWIKCDQAPAVYASGAIKERISDVNKAELIALTNAVAVARQRGMLKPLVMLQSDSMTALGEVMRYLGAVNNPLPGGKRPTPASLVPKDHYAVLDHLKRELAGIRVEVRHVKAHTDKSDGRSWVNRQVDKMAKQAMREKRDAAQTILTLVANSV